MCYEVVIRWKIKNMGLLVCYEVVYEQIYIMHMGEEVFYEVVYG